MFFSLRKALLIYLIVCGLFISRLQAQTVYKSFADEYNEAVNNSRWRFLFFRIIPTFGFYDVGHDSNVYFRDQSEGEVISDFMATLSPVFRTYWLVGNSVILSFRENPEYIFFASEERLRTLTNSYSPGIRLKLFNRVVLSGQYQFENHIRRAYDEFQQRLKDTMKATRLDLFYETPRGTLLGFGLTRSNYSYQSLSDSGIIDAGRALDRKENTLYFEFAYRIFKRSYLLTIISRSEHSFLRPEFSWRDASSTQFLTGLKFPLTGPARGLLTFGYKIFKPKSAGRKPFSGFVAESEFSYRAGIVGFSIDYSRNNYFSYLDLAYYYIEDRIKTGFSFYPWPFLRLDLNHTYGQLRYAEPYEIIYDNRLIIIESRLDRQTVDSAGVVIRLSGSLGAGLNFNLFKRKSNAPGFNIGRKFIGMFLTYDF